MSNGNTLQVKLQAALQQLDRGNFNAADNQMQAFINQRGAFRDADVLSPEPGQPLIDVVMAAMGGLAAKGNMGLTTTDIPSSFSLGQNYPNTL